MGYWSVGYEGCGKVSLNFTSRTVDKINWRHLTAVVFTTINKKKNKKNKIFLTSPPPPPSLFKKWRWDFSKVAVREDGQVLLEMGGGREPGMGSLVL